MKMESWNPRSWRGDKRILHVIFDLQQPIAWVGACSRPERSKDFCNAFEKGDLERMMGYQDREGDLTFALLGSSAKDNGKSILAIASSYAALHRDDEVIGIKELDFHPLGSTESDGHYIQQVEDLMPSRKSIWLGLLRAAWAVFLGKK